MQPIKLKLTFLELVQLSAYLYHASIRAHHPQAAEELIVLAEFNPVVHKKMVGGRYTDHLKPYAFSMPMSVARILHERWQNERIVYDLNRVLGAIDYELTRWEMKPDPTKPKIF